MTLYNVEDSQNTQNTQINKIGANEKCVFYFTEKTKQTVWPTHQTDKLKQWVLCNFNEQNSGAYSCAYNSGVEEFKLFNKQIYQV